MKRTKEDTQVVAAVHPIWPVVVIKGNMCMRRCYKVCIETHTKSEIVTPKQRKSAGAWNKTKMLERPRSVSPITNCPRTEEYSC